jgi:membrane protein DedA with SNARE-associated domain
VQRTTDWFDRFGPFIILLGRFVAVVRMLSWPVARARGVGYPTFLTLDVVAALLWTTLWVGLGWLLGAHWARTPAGPRMVGLAVGGLALLTLAIVGILRRRRRRPAVS